MSLGVATVVSALEDAGFESLPTPLRVADADFAFDAAVRGTGVSNDLVVVASNSSPPRRLIQLLSGLTRTLDRVNSRRPVTIVLLGASREPSITTELERLARVLTVASLDPDADEAKHAIAVLLPLTLPAATGRGRDPLAEVADAIGPSLSNEHRMLIEAAMIGPNEVRDTLRRFIDDAVQGEPKGLDS